MVLLVALALATCTKKPESGSAASGSVESSEILAREPVTPRASVAHILIGWAELAPAYRGSMDPRASARSKAEADKVALELLARVRNGEAIEPLMAEFSEDPGSAKSGRPYPVTPEAGLVEPFKNLSLRLNMGEAGLVLTDYGWHVIKRVQ